MTKANQPIPFALSPSTLRLAQDRPVETLRQHQDFDKLSPNGQGIDAYQSQPTNSVRAEPVEAFVHLLREPFDPLRANG